MEAGVASASADELLNLVYEELRKVATAKMAREAPGHTLQPTALIHEAWLRLGGGAIQHWESRKHFYAAAAQAMRHILIERARKRQCARHGGQLERVQFEEIEIPVSTNDDQLLLINESLEELTAISPEKAEVVKLRFFVGLDQNEIAELLHISPRTVERYWNYAKAWLYERLTTNA
jgi:RNA polymerase sigma factor (TIGR02999 family)